MATTYSVYFGTESGNLDLLVSGLTSAEMAATVVSTNYGNGEYITTYYWRVDVVNEFGTTTGDEWSFSTIQFDPPRVTYWYSTGGYYYQLLIDENGDYGSHPADGGVEDTDFVVVTSIPNFINTFKRLIVVAENKLYYEDI